MNLCHICSQIGWSSPLPLLTHKEKFHEHKSAVYMTSICFVKLFKKETSWSQKVHWYWLSFIIYPGMRFFDLNSALLIHFIFLKSFYFENQSIIICSFYIYYKQIIKLSISVIHALAWKIMIFCCSLSFLSCIVSALILSLISFLYTFICLKNHIKLRIFNFFLF